MTSSTWQIKEAVQRALDEFSSRQDRRGARFALFLKARWTAQGESKTTVPESTELILHTLPAAHLVRIELTRIGGTRWEMSVFGRRASSSDDHS